MKMLRSVSMLSEVSCIFEPLSYRRKGKRYFQVMLVLFLETEGWCVSFSGYAHACIAMCVSYVWFSSDDLIGSTSFFDVFFLLLYQNWFCSPN